MKDLTGRSYWEANVGVYDFSLRVLGTPFPAMIAMLREDLDGAERVLEVGAGTGVVTLAVASAAAHLVSTDYSARMVAKTRERVAHAGITNVVCEVQDVYALSYPAKTFDAVVAANVLHLVPDLQNALRSLAATVKPGGKLLLPTFCHGQTTASKAISKLLSLVGFPLQRRFTAADLAAELKAARLHIERTKILPGLIPITYVCVETTK